MTAKKHGGLGVRVTSLIHSHKAREISDLEIKVSSFSLNWTLLAVDPASQPSGGVGMADWYLAIGTLPPLQGLVPFEKMAGSYDKRADFMSETQLDDVIQGHAHFLSLATPTVASC